MMSRWLTVLVLGAGLGVWGGSVAQAEHGHRGRRAITVDPEVLHQQVREVEEELGELEALNAQNPDPRLRDRMARRMSVIHQRLREFHAMLREPPPPGPEPLPAFVAPSPMVPPEFARFLGELRRAPFSDSKVALVRDVASRSFFTTEQVLVVVDAVAHASDKVEVAAALYPRVVDPQNFYLVYSHIPFESDRERLRQRIGGH